MPVCQGAQHTHSFPCLPYRSRMHAIESHRMSHEQQQMDAYAAAVQEQQRRDQRQQHQQPGAAGGSTNPAESGSSSSTSSNGWQQILGLDPIAQKLRRSKLAKLAYRR